MKREIFLYIFLFSFTFSSSTSIFFPLYHQDHPIQYTFPFLFNLNHASLHYITLQKNTNMPSYKTQWSGKGRRKEKWIMWTNLLSPISLFSKLLSLHFYEPTNNNNNKSSFKKMQLPPPYTTHNIFLWLIYLATTWLHVRPHQTTHFTITSSSSTVSGETLKNWFLFFTA